MKHQTWAVPAPYIANIRNSSAQALGWGGVLHWQASPTGHMSARHAARIFNPATWAQWWHPCPALDPLGENRQVAPDMTTSEKWIAAAFGTDGLRAWAMHGAHPYAQVLLQNRMGAALPDVPLAMLAELPGDWLQPDQTLVLACGLNDAPYQPVPVNPGKLRPVAVPTGDARLDVLALPGLKQAVPPDVICGDETRIAGFLAAHEGWDGVICLTGPQTCWAHISAGEVVSFQTFLTGELYAAVSRKPPGSTAVAVADWDINAFNDALETTLSRPEKLAAALSSVRARDVLQGQSAEQAQARIWGALIGAELAAARPYWLGQQLAVIGPAETTALYCAALGRQGVAAGAAEDGQTTLAGLTAAWQRLQ